MSAAAEAEDEDKVRRPASAVSTGPRVWKSTHTKRQRDFLKRFTTTSSKLYGRRCAP
jgi:hypothetical protein